MIKIIYGPKGSGKTKKIITHANSALDICTGDIVFITDRSDYSSDVKTKIRFIDFREYGENCGEDTFKGFLWGLFASNSDVKRIYIDGINRITGVPADYMEDLVIALDGFAHKNRLEIYMTASCEKLPELLRQYVLK